MPIYGKKFRNLLFWNQTADDLETWYAALVSRVLTICSNNDPVLTLNHFTARSNVVPFVFVWEKA